MYASEEVYVCSNHPQLEHMGLLLAGDPTQERHEESRKTRVDEGSAVTRRPHDVAVETVKHNEDLINPCPPSASFCCKSASFCCTRN